MESKLKTTSALYNRNWFLKMSKRTCVFLLCNSVIGFASVNAFSNENLSIDANESFNIIEDQVQSTEITGSVVDTEGMPLVGATISEKGTSNGIVADFDGNFSLTVSNENAILVVSYLGYTTLEVSVAGQTEISITLKEDATGLDEVVVIGYGSVKRRDLTGAVSSVKSEDLVVTPVVNAVEALQGRVAGLDITRGDGRAGSGFNILLRGNRSLTASSEPIYIIDGIQGNINNLNSNDIESIEVLKDASSTAIYGSAGANGVIIISTKKGKEGRIEVDFNSFVSINANPSYPSPLQGNAWLNYLEEGFVASNGVPSANRDALLTAWNLSPGDLNPYIDAGKYVDWADETFRTGNSLNNTLSVRGGNEKLQGSFSLGHNKTEGIYPGDDINVYTMRSDVNVQTSKSIKLGITTGLIFKDQNQNRSRVNKAFALAPLGDVYDADGNINKYPVEGSQEPSVLANNIPGAYENNRKTTTITANPYVDFTIAKGLSLRSILGVSISNSRYGQYESAETYLKLTGSSAAERTGTYNTNFSYGYNWENILNYETSLANNHNIGATFITSYAYFQNEYSNIYGAAFTSDESLWYNLKAAPDQSLQTGYNMKKRSSYAGRLNYNYKGKYFITGSVRADGVSQLAEGNEWDYFPAGAIAWRISDEDFMQDVNWLSELKLRASYGVTGNSNIDAYTTLAGVTSGPQLLDLGQGLVQTFIPTEFVGNSNLGWEKSYNMNIGVDFGMLNNRISGSLEYYNTDTNDVIYERGLPSTVGGVGPKVPFAQNANIAEMNNQGVELTFNSRNIVKEDFQWNTTLTFAQNTEKVTSVDLGNVAVEELVSLGLFIGHQSSVFYDYKKIGVWQLGEEADAAVFGLEPGDVKIESSLTRQSEGVWTRSVTDDEGNVTEETYTAADAYSINSNEDRQIIGQEAPDWTLGLNNTFKYKAFDLSIFATGRYGQMIEGELLGFMRYGTPNLPDNYDYWTPTNPTNDYPRPYISRSTDDSEPVQGLNNVDGSYFKIKNITVGYTLPENLTSKIGLSNLRVYGTVYNSFIIAKSHLLDGLDPESGASDSFPLYKQMVFGINVSF